MCLAILPSCQIETLSESLIVYKVCIIKFRDNELYSSVQNYKYPSGKLQVCNNPFRLAVDRRECIYADTKEMVKIKALFGENLTHSWVLGKFYMITTGFHFYFTIKRALYFINLYNNPFDTIIVPFQIPAGARIIRGIDEELGVTDQIIRL